MLSFQEYITERFVNFGFGKDSELAKRKAHHKELFDVIQSSYRAVEGGYGGLGSGSKEEAESIKADIHHPDHAIKATRRNGKIVHVKIYKKTPYGRKSIAVGTDGSKEGKDAVRTTMRQDKDRKERHAYGEVSGAPENIQRKMGVPIVDTKHVAKILNKDIEIHDNERYSRMLGGTKHGKVMMGNPKL